MSKNAPPPPIPEHLLGLQDFTFNSALIDALPLALFCKDYGKAGDAPGIFVAWNHSAQELWGLKRETILGKSDYDFFPEDQADYFKQMDLKVIEGNSIHFIPEEPVDSPVLGRRHVRTWKVPLRHRAGDEHRFLLGLSIDISQQKLLEQELEAQREKSLYSAKLASLGEMAAGIAHEINNPLAVISGQIAVIKRELETHALPDAPTQERLIKGVGRVEDMIFRIAGIVGSLRKFARDATHDEHEVVTLGETVSDAVAICGQQIRATGVDLRIREENSGLRIRGNAIQISQVLVNLLLNAHAAVKSLPSPWVEIAFGPVSADRVSLTITDSGAGISAKVRDKIFQPFFTTKPVGEGTGLGLSISLGIMRDHGGSLELDTKSPHTCFVLNFPRID